MLDLDGPLSRSDREQLPLPKKKARRRYSEGRGAWERQHCFRKQFGGEGSVAGGVGYAGMVQDSSLARDGGVLKTGGRDKGVPRMDRPGMAVADWQMRMCA